MHTPDVTTLPQHLTGVATAPGHVLVLTFRGAGTHRLDLAPLVAQGGVFAALRDEGHFARVTLGHDGRFVEWPSGVDLCADALWLAAHGAHSLVEHALADGRGAA